MRQVQDALVRLRTPPTETAVLYFPAVFPGSNQQRGRQTAADKCLM